jgi:hypothetical protein
VGCDYHVLRGHGASVGRHRAGLAVVHVQRARVLEEVAAAAGDLLGERQEVLAHVELRLIVEPHRPLHRERERGLPNERGRESELLCGLDLRLELAHHLGGLGVGEGRQATEVAIDLPLVDEGLYAVYGRLIGPGVKAGLLLAVLLDELVVDQALLGGDLRRGMSRDAFGHFVHLDQRDRLAPALEEHGRGQAGDPAA